MYYKVQIDQTGKAIGDKKPSGEGYSHFNSEVISFPTLEQVREFLQARYNKVKKVKCYHGEGEHVGYIYCFKNRDDSHNSPPWFQQDWVTVLQVKEKILVVKGRK
jgi:hypothetical protein